MGALLRVESPRQVVGLDALSQVEEPRQVPGALTDAHELLVREVTPVDVAQQLPHLVELERPELAPDAGVLHAREVLPVDVDGGLAGQ